MENRVGSPEGNSGEPSEHQSTEASQDHEQLAYEQAAIYLEKGKLNEELEEFGEETTDKIRLKCYKIVHNTIYKVLDVLASLLLLGLAAIEPPAMLGMDVPIWLHAVMEMTCLSFLLATLSIKIKWQGIQYAIRHKRTVLKILVMIIMFVEAVAVLIRKDTHVRATRALRPLFVLDTYYFSGVRRVFRQILKSIPAFLDILILLLFFMLIFAILGFSLFSTNEEDPNFTTYGKSFVSLFVLVTTANYPDVMMPAYNKDKAAVWFFIIYITVVLYFLMNLLLATTYSKFTSINKTKFESLYKHKYRAARLAYEKIRDPGNEKINDQKFCKLLKCYKPRMSKLDVALVFKFLDKRSSRKLNFDEFRHIYGATQLSWRRKSNGQWFHNWALPKPISFCLEKIHLLVTKRFKKLAYSYFDIFIFSVIVVNGCVVISEIITLSNTSPAERDFETIHWYSYVFTAIYSLEAALKILALGPRVYCDSHWNWFDLLVTFLNILGSLDQGVTFAMYLRPIRLLLLFKLKKSYRVVFDTLRTLLPSLVRIGIVIVLLYYSFAIIGIESFSGMELKSCCRNLSVESEFEEGGYYYLNNFNDLFHSCITLFELTVINNWHVIMEGFAYVSVDWSRVFFMVFYLVILMVMTIVVAFILDTFVFCIELREKNHDSEKDSHKFTVEISITKEELKRIDPRLVRSTEDQDITYIGKKYLTRDDLAEEMHKDELKKLREEIDPKVRSQQGSTCHEDS